MSCFVVCVRLLEAFSLFMLQVSSIFFF
ncbi:unnamed protein product [Spodoptera littoralis]|uniref:Uncharacterized protein n=1 Tax=Spodoptera littoralis TaxID=7109 RepID=A0A9P0I3N3_SPOLI|nr:unnamed protein product [Spodoptera littoralis]CAH1639420.1 unnamed protein product [Spodoptera littoralis]